MTCQLSSKLPHNQSVFRLIINQFSAVVSGFLPSSVAAHHHMIRITNTCWLYISRIVLGFVLSQPQHLRCSLRTWHKSICPSVRPHTLVWEAPLHPMPHLKPATIHFTRAKIMSHTIGVCKKSSKEVTTVKSYITLSRCSNCTVNLGHYIIPGEAS